MSRMTKRVLTDGQWERVAPHLPVHAPSPKGGRPREDDRECLEGVLWLLRSGARWQDIPVDLPSGRPLASTTISSFMPLPTLVLPTSSPLFWRG